MAEAGEGERWGRGEGGIEEPQKLRAVLTQMREGSAGGGQLWDEAAVALPYFPSRLTSPLVPRP